MLLSVLVSSVSQFGIRRPLKNIQKSKINRKKDLTKGPRCGIVVMLSLYKG